MVGPLVTMANPGGISPSPAILFFNPGTTKQNMVLDGPSPCLLSLKTYFSLKNSVV